MSKATKFKTEPKQAVLSDSSLEAFCSYVKTLQHRSATPPRIIVMSGAGISTSAGIPDFRTPGTGLYSNLQKYHLPYAEAIFDIEYFLRKPQPFYELSRELFPGTFFPTPCHHFIKLLDEKGILLRNYSQNIDMLERLAGVQNDCLVEAHGSFHSAKCVGYARTLDGEVPLYRSMRHSTSAESASAGTEERDAAREYVEEPSDSESSSSDSDRSSNIALVAGCGKPYTIEEFKAAVFQNDVVTCADCTGLVKPDIVFFGEQLPDRFHRLLHQDFRTCDALIVMGTSLKVQPFASLIDKVREDVPRLLINMEEAGVYDPRFGNAGGFDFDGKSKQRFRRDAFFKGTCDDGVTELCRLMGWTKHFDALLASAARSKDAAADDLAAGLPQDPLDNLVDPLGNLVDPLGNLVDPLGNLVDGLAKVKL
ncbi:NAD-dependent protein deacetylase sirtuin-2 [Kappamyces sp. JEL0680]|nr:NAD-dependent protein deacetylase sirtuin-2 [Kappamyces sp. JEL0680]